MVRTHETCSKINIVNIFDTRRKAWIALLASCMVALDAHQAGFNGNGSITSTNNPGDTNAIIWYGAAIDSKNNIVVAGKTNSIDNIGWGIVARYTDAGALDLSFNGTGFVISTNNPGDTDTYMWNDAVIDAQNNIVVAGITNTSWGIVARYTCVGTLDTSFNGTGFITSSNNAGDTDAYTWYGATIDPQNNIILAGQTNIVHDAQWGIVARYTHAGSLDLSLNETGFVISTNNPGDTNAQIWSQVAIDAQNNIVVVGGTNAIDGADWGIVTRYTHAGALDLSFNGTGFVTSNAKETSAHIWYGLTIDPQNNIVVAGQTNAIDGAGWGVVARYTPEGALDTSFNGTGFVTSTNNPGDTNAHALTPTIDQQNNVVFAGLTANRWGIVGRYTCSGMLDRSFNHTGFVATNGCTWTKVMVDSHNNIVAVGQANNFDDTYWGIVARYTCAGLPA